MQTIEPTDGVAPPGEDEESRIVRLLRGLAERTFKAATVTMLQDAANLVESLRLGCDIAYRREPTQTEGDAHEPHRLPSGAPDDAGDATGECFVPMGGWTGNRCRVCSRWVWGGPTVCLGCVTPSPEYDRGYANAIGRIDSALGRVGASPLDETVRAVGALVLRADTDGKAKVAWEQLYNERNRLWRDAADKLDNVRGLLERNGCDCDCGHDSEGHDDDCDRCLACRIAWAVENVP